MTSDKYKCDICNKEFCNKYSLQKHKKSVVCAEKLKYQKCEICNKIYKNSNYLKMHLKTNKHIKNTTDNINITKNDKTIFLQNKHIKNAINNNDVIPKRNKKNINNDMNMIAHGEETFEGLSDDKKKSILKKCSQSILELISFINFNSEFPQNHNIYINSLYSGFGYLYNGNAWVPKKTTDLINGLIYRDVDNMERLLEEYESELSNQTISEIFNTIDILDYKPDGNFPSDKQKLKYKKEIMDDIKLLLYNDRHIPLKTKQINEKKNIC